MRVGRIESDVDGACLVVLVENFLPGLSGVERTEDASLRIGPVGMPQRGNEKDIGVARVHNYTPDVARIFEANVNPGFSRVCRPVHAIAMGDVAADAGLARPHVDHVGVRGRDGNAADGRHRLLIEQRSPIASTVGGLPDPSGDSAEVKYAGITRHPGHSDDAAAAERSNLPPLHALKERLVILRRRDARKKKQAHANQRHARTSSLLDKWHSESPPASLRSNMVPNRLAA